MEPQQFGNKEKLLTKINKNFDRVFIMILNIHTIYTKYLNNTINDNK